MASRITGGRPLISSAYGTLKGLRLGTLVHIITSENGPVVSPPAGFAHA